MFFFFCLTGTSEWTMTLWNKIQKTTLCVCLLLRSEPQTEFEDRFQEKHENRLQSSRVLKPPPPAGRVDLFLHKIMTRVCRLTRGKLSCLSFYWFDMKKWIHNCSWRLSSGKAISCAPSREQHALGWSLGRWVIQSSVPLLPPPRSPVCQSFSVNALEMRWEPPVCHRGHFVSAETPEDKGLWVCGRRRFCSQNTASEFWVNASIQQVYYGLAVARIDPIIPEHSAGVTSMKQHSQERFSILSMIKQVIFFNSIKNWQPQYHYCQYVWV